MSATPNPGPACAARLQAERPPAGASRHRRAHTALDGGPPREPAAAPGAAQAPAARRPGWRARHGPLVPALPALPQAACLRRCPGAGAVMRAACAASGMLGACRQTAPSVTAWRQSGPRAERPAAAGQARDGHPALRAQVDERGCGGGPRGQRCQRGRPQPLRCLRPLRRVPHEARAQPGRPLTLSLEVCSGCRTPLHEVGFHRLEERGSAAVQLENAI